MTEEKLGKKELLDFVNEEIEFYQCIRNEARRYTDEHELMRTNTILQVYSQIKALIKGNASDEFVEEQKQYIMKCGIKSAMQAEYIVRQLLKDYHRELMK